MPPAGMGPLLAGGDLKVRTKTGIAECRDSPGSPGFGARTGHKILEISGTRNRTRRKVFWLPGHLRVFVVGLAHPDQFVEIDAVAVVTG